MIGAIDSFIHGPWNRLSGKHSGTRRDIWDTESMNPVISLSIGKMRMVDPRPSAPALWRLFLILAEGSLHVRKQVQNFECEHRYQWRCFTTGPSKVDLFMSTWRRERGS